MEYRYIQISPCNFCPPAEAGNTQGCENRLFQLTPPKTAPRWLPRLATPWVSVVPPYKEFQQPHHPPSTLEHHPWVCGAKDLPGGLGGFLPRPTPQTTAAAMSDPAEEP